MVAPLGLLSNVRFIFKEFNDVFAGEFLYSNDDDLNRFKPEEDRPVPFCNMASVEKLKAHTKSQLAAIGK